MTRGRTPDVLEHALRELSGEHQELLGVDLSERVAAAWQRGERGSGWRAEEPETAPARRRAWPLLAAAAVVAALGGALAWRAVDTTREPAPLARVAPTPRALEGDVSAGGGLPAGAAFLVDVARPTTLEIDGGGTLDIEGAALVRLLEDERGARVELALGEAALACTVAPVRVRVGAAQVTAAPGARMALRVEADPASDEPGGPLAERARRLLDATRPPARQARVELLAGEATLALPSGPVRLEPGGCWVVGPGGAPAGAVTPADEELLAETLDALLHPKGYGLPSVPRWAASGLGMLELTAGLDEQLGRRPQLWPLFARGLREAFEDPEPRRIGRERALDLVVQRSDEAALALLRALWLVEPEAFAPRHVVALAERGLPEFEREPAAMLVFRWTDEPADLLLPAAWLALADDPDGKAHLRELAALPVRPARDHYALARKLLAASTLARVGEPGVWEETRADLGEQARAALAGGDLTRAAWIALALSFFDPGVGEVLAGGLGTSLPRLDRYAAANLEPLPEPRDVRRWLEGR